jgi:hypothetical protein
VWSSKTCPARKSGFVLWAGVCCGITGVPAVLGSIFTARLGIGRAGYAAALNDILVIGACVAMVSAVLSYALIRRRDFIAPQRPAPATQASGQDSGKAAAAPATDLSSKS